LGLGATVLDGGAASDRLGRGGRDLELGFGSGIGLRCATAPD